VLDPSIVSWTQRGKSKGTPLAVSIDNIRPVSEVLERLILTEISG
jgi:hypothetical protein